MRSVLKVFLVLAIIFLFFAYRYFYAGHSFDEEKTRPIAKTFELYDGVMSVKLDRITQETDTERGFWIFGNLELGATNFKYLNSNCIGLKFGKSGEFSLDRAEIYNPRQYVGGTDIIIDESLDKSWPIYWLVYPDEMTVDELTPLLESTAELFPREMSSVKCEILSNVKRSK